MLRQGSDISALSRGHRSRERGGLSSVSHPALSWALHAAIASALPVTPGLTAAPVVSPGRTQGLLGGTAGTRLDCRGQVREVDGPRRLPSVLRDQIISLADTRRFCASGLSGHLKTGQSSPKACEFGGNGLGIFPGEWESGSAPAVVSRAGSAECHTDLQLPDVDLTRAPRIGSPPLYRRGGSESSNSGPWSAPEDLANGSTARRQAV